MGARKLKYYQEREGLEVSAVFFGGVLEKKTPASKNRIKSYLYGFNGQERDDEVSGSGNAYTTEFRGYDPRLGRWKSIDPLASSFPWQSPYVAFDNNPIYFVDPRGLAAEGGDDKKNKLGAPVASKSELSAKHMEVSEDEVSKTVDNDFTYRSEEDRKGYNYYWNPNGGERVYSRDGDGNMIPKEGGGYQTEMSGSYIAVHYLRAEQYIMTDPGQKFIAAIDPIAPTFGWTFSQTNATGLTATTGSTNFTSRNGIAGASRWISSQFAALDASSTASTSFSNYSVTLNRNVPNLSVANFNTVIAGISRVATISSTGTFNDPTGVNVSGHPALWTQTINYTITQRSWGILSPGSPGRAGQDYIAPSFGYRTSWIKQH